MENKTETDRIATLEAKIDELTKVVKKINRTVNPPWWQKILLFIYHNFFTILLLVALGYISWKAWNIYLDILQQVAEVKAQIAELKQIPGNIQTSLQTMFENALQQIKFW
ncbi:hypothetical protein HC823_01925 [Candidatus Gracilibacteria bacterium]|nr:hypothetical protein [Candidatus Gracilibacteria bacterium]